MDPRAQISAVVDRVARAWADAASARPFFVWVILVLWFGATAWIRPLAMPDEGRYLGVAWEMLAQREWLVPTQDGLPFFHKPPLFYWLAELAMRVAGTTPFVGRVPNILAAASLAYGVYRFTLAWAGARRGRLALVVLATSPYLYIGAQYANMDMLVAACIGGAVLCAAHAVLRVAHGRTPGAALYGAYAFAALGVLAKGLIGCVLPALVVVSWLVASRQSRLILRLLSPGAIVLFAAIVLPWPLAMQARYPGFFDYFIVEQHLHRFSGSGFNNAQPWWFYLPVLFALMLPWSLALPRALRSSTLVVSRTDSMLRMLMLCWLLVVLVFFSIPESKLIGYVLPAAPAAAWLAADGISSLDMHAFMRRHQWATAAGTSIVLLVAVLSYGWRAPHSAHPIAAALARERAQGEPVEFVNAYPYDVVFEARLEPPLAVIDHWSDPALQEGDSWQRELIDAARFKPDAGRGRLLEQLPETVGRTWVITPRGSGAPAQEHARVVAQTGELQLWEVERR